MPNPKLVFRALFKSPFVTLVAIVSLALGIGANSAIFSLFNRMLLRPLPVEAPDRLVNLAAPGPNPGSQACTSPGDCRSIFSYPMFRDLQKARTGFSGIAAHRPFSVNLSFRGQTEAGRGTLVSGSYFPVLGLQPAAGRLLSPADDDAIGAHFVTVLSYAYWQRRFDGDPAVVGQPLVVNGQPMTIVGVTPQGFEGTTLGEQPQVFVPVSMYEVMFPGFTHQFDNRRRYWMYLFARLAPGVSIEQARTAVNVPYHAIINDVEARLQTGMSNETMKRFRAKVVTVAKGWRGQSRLHREVRTPILFLLGITGVVVLIACANIANLLLARAATRTTEMAVRLSLGASRRQLVTQLLAESCLLAVLGGAAGLLVARWTLALLTSLLPAEQAVVVPAGLDGHALAFTAALAVATGLLFGLFPALHSTRPDLAITLKNQAGQPGGGRGAARFRTALATSQIALSMTLLIAAGLLTRSLLNVSRVDLGVKTDHLVTFFVSPWLNGYKPEQSRALFARIEEEIGALPGVAGVSASMVPLLTGESWGNDVTVEGFPGGPDVDMNSRYSQVEPGYFRTVGIPVLSGRDFTDADTLGAPKVAIVNEAFAKKFNLGRDAVGRRMRLGRRGGDLDITIVGLVQNARYSEVKSPVPAYFVLPSRQDDDLGFLTFYVRTSHDPKQIIGAIPAIMRRLDPTLLVEALKTMDAQVRENVFLDRMLTTLSAAFAALATLLAAVGLYGVLAYTVAQRTREFGLRMALGADGPRLRRTVMARVAWMTLAGGLVGIAVALGLGRAARSLLYEMQASDPVVTALSVVLLGLVALGAGFIPALRASRIDPMKALRYE